MYTCSCHHYHHHRSHHHLVAVIYLLAVNQGPRIGTLLTVLQVGKRQAGSQEKQKTNHMRTLPLSAAVAMTAAVAAAASAVP